MFWAVTLISHVFSRHYYSPFFPLYAPQGKDVSCLLLVYDLYLYFLAWFRLSNSPSLQFLILLFTTDHVCISPLGISVSHALSLILNVDSFESDADRLHTLILLVHEGWSKGQLHWWQRSLSTEQTEQMLLTFANLFEPSLSVYIIVAYLIGRIELKWLQRQGNTHRNKVSTTIRVLWWTQISHARAVHAATWHSFTVEVRKQCVGSVFVCLFFLTLGTIVFMEKTHNTSGCREHKISQIKIWIT